MTGAPAPASWWITTPERFSAQCCTTASRRVTGAVAPAMGMETSWAGMPARAQSIRAWQVRSLHLSGGVGAQSKMARGFSRRALLVAPHRHQHLAHHRKGVLLEGAGDHRLATVISAMYSR